ncbi:MAG: hypothetical protein KL863_07380 [Rhizobium sp.]|nr:hypothetical protein [Rhizobium sp.]MBX9455847.1 hypothetical protein [Rhizobium sp.]
MSVLDFSDVLRGRGRAVSEHTIKISYGEGYVTTIKGDFNFNKKGDVTGGTVTKIDFENDDHYGNVLTGIDLSLGSFVRDREVKNAGR